MSLSHTTGSEDIAVDQLEDHASSVVSALRRLDEELTQANAKIDSLNDEIGNLKEEISDLKEQLQQ